MTDVAIRLYTASSSFKAVGLDPNEIFLRGKTVCRNGVTVRMSAPERRMFLILAVRQHRHTSSEEIIHLLYGDDPDGGPDCADSAVKVGMSTLRDAGAALGFRIHVARGRGYMLVPIAYEERADAA